MNKRAHVFVTGKVQGVYFRSYTVDKARILGLTGWVRNIRGNRVEAVFEGEGESIDKMIEWCWEGSPSSKVEDVEVQWETPTGEFFDFSIGYGYRGDR
jgi:acylphosphatase